MPWQVIISQSKITVSFYYSKNGWHYQKLSLAWSIFWRQCWGHQGTFEEKCKKGHKEALDILLDANADPNIYTKANSSPLMIALTKSYFNGQVVTAESQISIPEKLFQKGAHINHQDDCSLCRMTCWQPKSCLFPVRGKRGPKHLFKWGNLGSRQPIDEHLH